MKVEKHLSSLPVKLSSIDISKFLKVLPVKINGKIMDFINSKHEYNEPFTSHDEKILVKQLKAKTRLVSLGDKNLTRKGIISKKFKNGFYSSLEENSDIANFMVKFENENFTAFTHLVRGLVFGYPINRVLNFAFARFIELSMTKSDIARRCMGWLDGKIFKCYMLNIDRHWAQRIRKFGNVVQYVHPFYTDLAVEIHLNQSIIVQYFYKQINDV